MPGLDPRWSRRVDAADADGVRRSWHVLDNGAEPVHGTMLCVHGNPTWSYLWRRFLAAGAGRLAGGRGGPARHGLVRAHRRPGPWPSGSTTSAPSPTPWASPGPW